MSNGEERERQGKRGSLNTNTALSLPSSRYAHLGKLFTLRVRLEPFVEGVQEVRRGWDQVWVFLRQFLCVLAGAKVGGDVGLRARPVPRDALPWRWRMRRMREE